MFDTVRRIATGVPLMLQLAAISIAAGAVFAMLLALMRVSAVKPLDLAARGYVFVFRGTPLLVQIFLIYYGLGQFPEVRATFLWPFLREPYWCAILALTLNTAAYGSRDHPRRAALRAGGTGGGGARLRHVRRPAVPARRAADRGASGVARVRQ